MRILFFTHYFHPEGNAPATRVREFARHWVQQGHDVTVVTCAPNVPDGVVYPGYQNRWFQREEVDGIEVIRVWTWLAANAGTALRILNFVSYMLTATLAGLRVAKPDIVIATSPQFFAGWAGVFVAKLRRRPFVLEIRDLWPESIVAVGAMADSPWIRALEWLEKRMYAAADLVVTVGEGYRRKLVARGVPEGRLRLVPNGVNRAMFQPDIDGSRVRAEYGIEERFVCSYIGTIGMGSGLGVALRAARLLRESGRKDVCLLLVGDGAVREDLERQARDEGLDNVIFTGRQPKERMPEFLAASDACLVHLIRQELFQTVLPSKIFEAAALARPMILGVEGFAAELMREADAGLCIEPENERELVKALIELADDAALRERLGRNALREIATRFDVERLATSYLEILRELDMEARR
jgi:glycosyltransferase involved in cell wall biosynthesis